MTKYYPGLRCFEVVFMVSLTPSLKAVVFLFELTFFSYLKQEEFFWKKEKNI